MVDKLMSFSAGGVFTWCGYAGLCGLDAGEIGGVIDGRNGEKG
jgi:hypothetical protein